MDKRYHLFSDALKRRFGGRVHKISVDAGFGCPNRTDGRQGGGCIFCDPGGSGAVGIDRRKGVAEQIEAGKEVMTRKYRAQHFLAYFQAFSNTAAPVDQLRALYTEALAVPGVVGLCVGTRPDCVPDPVLDLLQELAREHYLWLELGLQSLHDPTLQRIRRGHDVACFVNAVRRAHGRGLPVCAHVILGLPGETRAMMLETVDGLARLGVEGIKLHLLHVLEGTELAEDYRRGDVPVMTQDDYVEMVADVLERLPAQMLIHRLTGDGPRERLLAPLWSLKKWEVLNAIDAAMARRGTRQGDRCEGSGGANQP